jgi:hypothetical protein
MQGARLNGGRYDGDDKFKSKPKPRDDGYCEGDAKHLRLA